MIPKNIRTLRKVLGLSMADFAARVGVSVSVIKNLEYDKIQNVEAKMPLLRLIAKEYGVSLDWIINGTGDPELPEVTDRERRAERLGQLIGRDDPVTMAFLDFIASRSQTELELIAKQLQDFSGILDGLRSE